jgi:hypothetical protein
LVDLPIIRHKSNKFFGYYPIEVKVNGEDALAFSDGHGYLMDKETFFEMIDLAKKFYDSADVDEMIKEENKRASVIHHHLFHYVAEVDGKYLLPQPEYQEKKFKTDKRHWSFTCTRCGKKVSSAEQEKYYNFTLYLDKEYEVRCCSKECIEQAWYEIVKGEIYRNNFQDYFHIDKANTSESF